MDFDTREPAAVKSTPRVHSRLGTTLNAVRLVAMLGAIGWGLVELVEAVAADTEATQLHRALSFLGLCAVAGGIGFLRFTTSVMRCPACRAKLSANDENDDETVRACPACHAYLEIGEQLVRTFEPDRIAQTAVFTADLPDEPAWPTTSDGVVACCVCGGAGRLVELTWSFERVVSDGRGYSQFNTDGPTASGARTTRTQPVPHCSDHEQGAVIVGSDTRRWIAFRSLRYLRAFCDVNRSLPGALSQNALKQLLRP